MEIIVWLAIIVILILVAWFLISKIALPEPAGTIIQIVIVVVVAFVAISLLMQLTGMHIPHIFGR